MVLSKYWTELYENDYGISQDLTASPIVMEHLATGSSSDSILRSVWFPRLDVYYDSTAGAPIDYWWIGAIVNLMIVWDPDGLVPITNVPDESPSHVASFSLDPVFQAVTTTGKRVVSFQGPKEGCVVETSRKGHGAGVNPGLLGELWAFDHTTVFLTGSNSHVNISFGCISRALWGTP